MKICNKTDDFLKYTTIVTSGIFKKKIEQECEIPNCHSKQYNSFDFLDNFEDNNNTGPSIIEHAFSVNAKEVSSLGKNTIHLHTYILRYILKSIFFSDFGGPRSGTLHCI